MVPRTLRLTMILASLSALLVTGLAVAQTPSSGDVVADRQRLMKLNSASLMEIQAKAKATNLEGVAVSAETIAVMAPYIPALFPAGLAGDTSGVKRESPSHCAMFPPRPPARCLEDPKTSSEKRRWSQFEGNAKNLQGLAEKLRDAARAKDGPMVEAIAKDFGQQGCDVCHTSFRRPPKQ
jgi:cytochrome c556